MMRRFEVWWKDVAADGTTTTGCVADGVQFRNGLCVASWRTGSSGVTTYRDLADITALHADARIVFLDPSFGVDTRTLQAICFNCLGGHWMATGERPVDCPDCAAGVSVIYVPDTALDELHEVETRLFYSRQGVIAYEPRRDGR